MSTRLVDLASTLECPQCGKHAIVSHQAGIYHCLSCDFERDLSATAEAETTGGLGSLIFAGAGFLITLMLLL
jgi:ribosomal protein L37AE/L43A